MGMEEAPGCLVGCFYWSHSLVKTMHFSGRLSVSTNFLVRSREFEARRKTTSGFHLQTSNHIW